MSPSRTGHVVRFLVCLFCAITLAAGVAVAVGQVEVVEDSVDLDTLVLSYPRSVSSIPILALMAEHPEDYTGTFFTDHPQALAQLVNGQTDVLATGFSVGYSRFRSVGDVVHIMTPVWGVSALMTAEDVESIQDLAGGVVYAPFEGSPIDVYLKAILEDAGVRDQVEIEYAPFPQASALLVQGRADAAVLVEPLASKLETDGTAYRLQNLHEGWERVSGEERSPQVSFFATTTGMQAIEAEVAVLAERLEELVDAVAEDPAFYAQAFAEDIGFPVPVVERALENTLFDTPDSAETRSLIEEYTGFMDLGTPTDSFYASMNE